MSINGIVKGKTISYRFHNMSGEPIVIDVKNNGNVLIIRDTRVFIVGDVIRVKLLPEDKFYQVMEQKGCYITLWSN